MLMSTNTKNNTSEKNEISIEDLLGLELDDQGTYLENETNETIFPRVNSHGMRNNYVKREQASELSDYEELLQRYGPPNQKDVHITNTVKKSALPVILFFGGLALAFFILFVVITLVAGESFNNLYER